jgi:hypothetical protein
MSDAKKDAERLAQLEAEVAALKASLAPKPEPKPFVPTPYQRYDPTAGMSMPLSTLREMAGHPCNQVMRGVIQDRHAPTGRPGMIPTQPASGGGPVAGDGKGFAREIPIGPPPGIDLIDRAVNAALPHGPEWGKK